MPPSKAIDACVGGWTNDGGRTDEYGIDDGQTDSGLSESERDWVVLRVPSLMVSCIIKMEVDVVGKGCRNNEEGS